MVQNNKAPVALEYGVDSTNVPPRLARVGKRTQIALGVISFGIVAFLATAVRTMALAQWIPYERKISWMVVIALTTFTLHVHTRWRWTDFTIGVLTGLALVLLGFGLFFVYLWFALSGMR